MKTLTADTKITIKRSRPALTGDTKIRLSQIKDLAAWVEDRRYGIGEISTKTGLMKTTEGWVVPPHAARMIEGQEGTRGGSAGGTATRPRVYSDNFETNKKELQSYAEPNIKKLQEEHPEYIASIQLYTGPGSGAMNEAMRTSIKDAPAKVQRNIANISQALARNKVGKDVVAYRTIGADQETLNSIFPGLNLEGVEPQKIQNELNKKLKRGLTYQEKAFLSTSINPNYKHHENQGNGVIKMKLQVPAETRGLYVDSISTHAGKSQELLLQRNTCLIYSKITYNVKTNEYYIEATVKGE